MARTILTSHFDCFRCGLQNAAGSTHCAACGNVLGAGAFTPPPALPAAPTAVAHAVPMAVAVAASAPAPSRSFAEWFGWRRLDGTVIHAGLQQMGRLQKEWWEVAVKLMFVAAIFVVFGVTALVILLLFAVLSLAFSRRRSASQRPGFLQNLATQVASFLIVGHLFGPKKSVPVCDYRIRDANGTESLVRVEGHVVQGSLAAGDDVSVEGFDHRGTLILRRGWNRRLQCAIRIERR